MQHDSRAYLWEVRRAADAILDFVAGINLKTCAETQVIHSAVERKFQIIGDVINPGQGSASGKHAREQR